jgi:HPt (histidine-containing phosphotransfer) domain-containing protein
MIDWTRVGELRDEIGEEGFLEVVELFLDEVEEVVARLHATGDAETHEADLHFLKGSAWNLGFAELGALCQDGERFLAQGQDCRNAIGRILDCYGRSKAAFVAGLADPARRGTAA